MRGAGAAGGELAGAITYVVETAPTRAPFVCSVVFGFVTAGVALATTIALVVQRVLTDGFETVKEFQKAEVMVAPSLQTEGKSLQRSQGIGMGR